MSNKKQLSDADVRQLYDASGDGGKAILEKKFGKQFFMKGNKTEAFIAFCKKIGVDHTVVPQIETWEEVCKALKRNPKKYPDFSGYDKEDREYAKAHFMWLMIIKALNGGKKLDYTNWEERKYWQYVYELKKSKSGFGFSFSRTTYGYSYAFVSSRLCSIDWNIAKYAVERFPHVFCTMING